MIRLAIFADPRHLGARILLPATLAAIAGRSDIVCAAIFTPPLPPLAVRRWRWRYERLRRRLQVLCRSGRWERALNIPPLDLDDLRARYATEILTLPDDGDPNHPKVLRTLRERLAADRLLNLYLVRRFGAALLDAVAIGVNYHNGRLPAFRGLAASNWSIYAGERRSGYCFHRLDSALDSGALLAPGEVASDPGETPADLELRKAEAAIAALPTVLDALVRGDVGEPQGEIACLHNRYAREVATRVLRPEDLTRHEWERRLSSFLRVHAHLDGVWQPVTGLAPAAGPGHKTFRSADGHWLRVTGLDFWPAAWAGLALKRWRQEPPC